MSVIAAVALPALPDAPFESVAASVYVPAPRLAMLLLPEIVAEGTLIMGGVKVAPAPVRLTEPEVRVVSSVPAETPPLNE